MELFLFVYLQPILCKSGLKNDFFDISKICFPMILWTFFQTSDGISRYKKCFLSRFVLCPMINWFCIPECQKMTRNTSRILYLSRAVMYHPPTERSESYQCSMWYTVYNILHVKIKPNKWFHMRKKKNLISFCSWLLVIMCLTPPESGADLHSSDADAALLPSRR